MRAVLSWEPGVFSKRQSVQPADGQSFCVLADSVSGLWLTVYSRHSGNNCTYTCFCLSLPHACCSSCGCGGAHTFRVILSSLVTSLLTPGNVPCSEIFFLCYSIYSIFVLISVFMVYLFPSFHFNLHIFIWSELLLDDKYLGLFNFFTHSDDLSGLDTQTHNWCVQTIYIKIITDMFQFIILSVLCFSFLYFFPWFHFLNLEFRFDLLCFTLYNLAVDLGIIMHI